MVVGQDDGRCIARQGLFDDFARVNAGPVDGAAEQLVKGDEPVTVVQVQAAEHLVGSVAQLRDQKLPRRLRGL